MGQTHLLQRKDGISIDHKRISKWHNASIHLLIELLFMAAMTELGVWVFFYGLWLITNAFFLSFGGSSTILLFSFEFHRIELNIIAH